MLFPLVMIASYLLFSLVFGVLTFRTVPEEYNNLKKVYIIFTTMSFAIKIHCKFKSITMNWIEGGKSDYKVLHFSIVPAIARSKYYSTHYVDIFKFTIKIKRKNKT